MEIELKYLLTEAIAKDRVLEDKHLQEIQDPDSEETIHMRAIYFDTADNSLRGKEMAFRVREENDRRVATLKWGGSADGGLHVRGELNVPVVDDFAKAPRMDIFNAVRSMKRLRGRSAIKSCSRYGKWNIRVGRCVWIPAGPSALYPWMVG